MTYNLVELMEKLGKTEASITGLFFPELFRVPDEYRSEKVKEYQERRTLGQQLIPREGAIVNYADNDNRSLQTEEFKAFYPEPSSGDFSGVVDVVQKVALQDDKGLVELTLERYLIKPKN